MHGPADVAVRDVLYVEDNALNALLMQSLFERRPDLRLVLAGDCAEALRCASARPPALLLLDLRLPDGHGCALLPALRALPGLADVPAVAVTAEVEPALDLRGFDGLWPKPLQIAAVLDHLERLLPPQRLAQRGRPAPPAPGGYAGGPPSGAARSVWPSGALAAR